ncbi:MAG: ATP-dependent helicase [Peptococcaceae bacterium BRH_c4a]|nr:MAG: ATP-dependent helicase [Peptococcaceae bacterium BRH_c4a]
MKENTNWTGEQWEAITGKDCNLLVAAAAGAGKTAVLVERIIRKITDPGNPVDIDRLLIVTFTNAAATEMRERIAEAISAVLEKNPGSKNIQRQLTLLNKASITTIHSFCLEVIRSNFQSINIDPGFRITDETEAALMKLEVLNDLFEDQYEKEENGDFFELLECYGGNRDDQAVQDMVLNLFSFIQSSPWPEKWLDGMTESFNAPEGLDFGDTPWGRVLLNSVMLELCGLKEMIARAADILKYAAGLEKYLNVYLEDLSSLDALSKVCTDESGTKWDAVYGAIQSLEFKRLPSAGKDADKEKQEYVKKIRDDVKARIKRMKEKTFTADSAEILNDMKAMYPIMKCLAGLVSDFGERYSAKKSQKSVVDFNDLEHFCLEILSQKDEHGEISPSGAALGYRDRYAEILVDEYQDSNLIQEIMISMVSRADTAKPNVFMVGDVKQSIYRFRQAKPELFLDKYSSYSTEKGNPFRKILLFKNFRSRKEIVNAVNFIFQQIMSVSVGELDYTDIEALNPGAVFAENDKETTVAGGAAEFHLIQTGGGGNIISEEELSGEEQESAEEEPDDEEMLDSIQCEARLAAKRIRELMQPDDQGREFRIFDRGRKAYRKADYRDMVILLRTVRRWSDVFMEELAMRGIPAFADTGAGFFKTSEVQVILSLLQIIDNPLQDIPLLSVIRSPIVSFTTDELAELRLARRKAALYDALQVLAQGGESQAAKKAASFLNDLRRWRDMSLYMATDQLLWQLYNETGYFGTVGAMPAGEQRQANLRILFERARQFEETAYKGLFNFINFVDKLKSSKGDMGSAKILGENDNVVRIMSIHKSKGLEFPVVILSGCGKKFNLQDMNKSILLHQELGFGPDVVDHRRRLSYPSAPKQAIREKIKAETLSEEMRILYVALTRAREKLIITGAVRDVPKAAAKWAKCADVPEHKLPAYEMLKGGSYLDWIVPALLRHKDCGVFRESAGIGSRFGGLLIEDPSVWGIRIWNKSDVLSGKTAKEHDQSQFIQWLDGLDTAEQADAFPEEIAGRLSWEYQYEKASKVPAKVSVTELKRRFDAELLGETGAFSGYLPALVKKPLFLEEKKGLSAAEAGTVLHFVMQRLNYKQVDMEAQIEEMVAKDLLTEQQAKSVDVDKIRRFLESPLGSRLLASESVNREVPFNMEIPCHELYPDMRGEAYQGETLLLQGVIDCYFEEPDGIVLLDYKTDYAPVGKVETIRERYRLQISYYARALEMLTGKKVREKYIYLFWNGEVLVI